MRDASSWDMYLFLVSASYILILTPFYVLSNTTLFEGRAESREAS